MTTANDNKAKSLIEVGSELAGAAIGGALGFLAGGPIGAAGAGVAGVAIAKGANKLLGDFACRQLSDREAERVGATAAVALDQIRISFEAGNEPRNDGFFESKGSNRSAAEELFEGTLRKSRDEHEEKKVQLLGRFYANISFSPGVSVGEANYFLSLIDSLTYRQLCVLGWCLLKPHTVPPILLRKEDYTQNNSNLDASVVSLLQEIYSLNQKGLVACKDPNGVGYTALLGWHDVIPNNIELTGLGERLARLMGAGQIDRSDIDQIIFLLIR